MLVGIGQVRNVMTTGTTLVPSFTPYLKVGLLSLHSMLLTMLGLLQRGVRLQDNSIHSTSQRVVSPLRERVHNRRWSDCMLLLLPRLRHPATSHARDSVLSRRGRHQSTQLRGRWCWL